MSQTLPASGRSGCTDHRGEIRRRPARRLRRRVLTPRIRRPPRSRIAWANPDQSQPADTAGPMVPSHAPMRSTGLEALLAPRPPHPSLAEPTHYPHASHSKSQRSGLGFLAFVWVTHRRSPVSCGAPCGATTNNLGATSGRVID
jgi:hypothetical protein